MTRLGVSAALLVAIAPMLSAQAPVPARGPAPVQAARTALVPAHTPASPAPPAFAKYCFECHSAITPAAGLNIEKLVKQPSVATGWQDWERVVRMLESEEMPPLDAQDFPTDAERKVAISWIRSSLDAYDAEHGGEPGRVTVRRLTSAEYAYAVH